MDIQRIRNLTTGKLHTEIGHTYQDIEYLTGEAGIMTHHLGVAAVALRPFLVERLTDARFWDGKYDTSHQGDVEVHPLTEGELKLFWPAFDQGMEEFWKTALTAPTGGTR